MQHEEAGGRQSAKTGNSGHKRMGQLLCEAGLITAQQLDEALQIQQLRGGRLVETLVSLKYMKPAAFVDFLARQPGVASIDLLNYAIPPEVTRLVPRELALKHEVFPIDQLGILLTLGMACPIDAEAIAELEQVTRLRVKAVLCSATDVRAAIQRYYPPPEHTNNELWDATDEARRGLGSALKLQSAALLVRQMRNLPALPETIDAVRRVMLEIDTTANDAVSILRRDPAMVAKVLSVGNSPAYGFPGHVNDLETAVTLMGLREVYSVALSASIMHPPPGSVFDYGAFWIEAMACADQARRIAESSGHPRAQGVYWAGLLHDLGRIVLFTVAPEIYGTLPPDASGADLIEAEESHFGLAHTEAGFELAIDWNLPLDIAETIRFHHAPERATGAKDTVAAVALAETLIHARAHALHDDEQTVCTRCLSILNISKAHRKSFLKELDGAEALCREWAAQWTRFAASEPAH